MITVLGLVGLYIVVMFVGGLVLEIINSLL